MREDNISTGPYLLQRGAEFEAVTSDADIKVQGDRES
jgi:hypothetical protein